MADERYTFEQTRIRLEEIAAQARKKDTSLEKSLDLLEEGARLALQCTELVDHTDFGDGSAATDDTPADPAPAVLPGEDAASTAGIAAS